MIVGAMSGRGTLPWIRVPHNAKINATYYIDEVLKPLLEEEIPKRYPGETYKVIVNYDAASSHSARITTPYPAELKKQIRNLNYY